jgi:hypothetical protein
MNVIKLPYSVTRRSHARKLRRSKNGTPEERAARVAPATLAPVVSFSARMADAKASRDIEFLTLVRGLAVASHEVRMRMAADLDVQIALLTGGRS